MGGARWAQAPEELNPQDPRRAPSKLVCPGVSFPEAFPELLGTKRDDHRAQNPSKCRPPRGVQQAGTPDSRQLNFCRVSPNKLSGPRQARQRLSLQTQSSAAPKDPESFCPDAPARSNSIKRQIMCGFLDGRTFQQPTQLPSPPARVYPQILSFW